jgi:hypothetical protein
VNVPTSWRVLPYDIVRKAIYFQISFRKSICSFRDREKLIPPGTLTLMRNKARDQQWWETKETPAEWNEIHRMIQLLTKKGTKLLETQINLW